MTTLAAVMKIAYVTGEYPRATDTFIQREVAGLRDKGIEVDTFSIRKPGDKEIVGIEQKVERQNTFYILPANPFALLTAHVALLVRSPKRYFKSIKLAWNTRQPNGLSGVIYQLFYWIEAGLLAHKINQKNIQHLHNHFGSSSGNVAMLAAEIGGFSYSFTLHGSYIFFEPRRWQLDKKIEKALFVCCISHFCRSQGMMFAAPEHWDKMHVIHCGIDPDLFKQENRKQENRKQAYIEPDQRSDLPAVLPPQTSGQRILYVGRLAAGKGLPILFESLIALKSSYPNFTLDVVGDGSDRENLEALVEQFGLSTQVNFLGYKSQSEVREQLQRVDIFVLPSFSEGVPVVLMEAMAAGVPVVATKVGGICELVDDGVNGFLATPGDHQSLTAYLGQLLADPQLRARFAAHGQRKVAEEFNIHTEVERLYKVLCAAKAGTRESIRPATVETAEEEDYSPKPPASAKIISTASAV